MVVGSVLKCVFGTSTINLARVDGNERCIVFSQQKQSEKICFFFFANVIA